MDYGYELDVEEFWRKNAVAENSPGAIPLGMTLDGDWICEHLQLDNSRYYSEYEYQQSNRVRCNEITSKELGLGIGPAVDFGVIMDASVYGGKVNYRPNATPTLEPAVQEPDDIDDLVKRMQKVDLLEQGLIPKFLEWRTRIKKDFGVEIGYGWGSKGCATMMGQICSITDFLTWIMIYPDQIRKLIDCWHETTIKYMKAMQRATGFAPGRRGFSFASDVTGMLSPELYRDFIMAAEKDIYQTFAPGPDDVRYYHADFRMAHHLDSLREIGVNVVNVDPYIEVKDILGKMPQVTIDGQVPPLDVLYYGTPEEVIKRVRLDIDQTRELGGKLVVRTVGSIVPGTSFANLRAMMYAVEQYGL